MASFCFNCPQLGLVYLGVTRFSAILAPLGFTWSHSFVYLIPLEFTRSLLVSFASPLLHFVSCGFHLVAKGNFHLPRGRLVCYSLTLFDSVSLRDKKKKWERCSICLESPPDIIVWNLASWIQDADPQKTGCRPIPAMSHSLKQYLTLYKTNKTNYNAGVMGLYL